MSHYRAAISTFSALVLDAALLGFSAWRHETAWVVLAVCLLVFSAALAAGWAWLAVSSTKNSSDILEDWQTSLDRRDDLANQSGRQ